MSKPDERYMEERIEQFLTSQEQKPLVAVSGNMAAEPEAHYGSPQYEYRSLPHTMYNAKLALVPEEIAAFVSSTQPKKWNELVVHCGSEEKAMMTLARRVSQEIDQHGIIKVLREVEVSTI